MANRIQHRRDTAANWTSINPVLAAGEIGVETDTTNTKLGDGVTAWVSLGYQAPNAATLSATYANKPAGIADGQVPVWQASTSQFIPGSGGGGSSALIYTAGAYPARPSGAVAVTYIGPVQPTTWLANDTWVDNS